MGEPQKDANTSTSVMDSALNAAATIQLAHSNATAKQQQQQQQAGVAAMASAAAVSGGDLKLPARQNSTQGQSRRASSTSLSSADAADAITSMRHLIDKSVITSSTSSSSGVASRRTSLEPVPLRGSFLSSAAALSIEPNPIPLPESSMSAARGSVAARASRMANQMMPPPRAMSAAAAMPAPAPLVNDVSMMQNASIMSRRISAPQLDVASAMNNMNNFMDPSSLAQEAPLKAPPPQYNSSSTKAKTAKTAADRFNSNDQRRKSVSDIASTNTNNNADEPTIEELALLRILRP